MNRRRRRRRPVNYRGGGRNNFEKSGSVTTVVIVICLSVVAGYLTAAYLLGPALGLETDTLSFTELTKENEAKPEETKPAEDGQTDAEPDRTEGLAESGYVLQYGSFSTMDAAKKCVSDLKRSGIDAEIMEKDGAYKVISQLFDTEQDARSKMENQKNIVDVFITEVP